MSEEASLRPPTCDSDGHVTFSAAVDSFLRAGHATLIPTGWTVALPAGCEGRLTLSPALPAGVVLVNSPCGTLDADYVGLPVGAIVRAETDLLVRAGSPLLRLALWPHVPPPGAVGSPVRIVAGECHVGSPWSAGADIRADLHQVSLGDRAQCTIPTMVVLEFPPDITVELRSRSGLALRAGLSVAAPYAVTSQVRIAVPTAMRGHSSIVIARNERIAQVVATRRSAALFPLRGLERFPTPASLPRPASGRTGGFGSTGLR
jgi:dUTPase